MRSPSEKKTISGVFADEEEKQKYISILLFG
jgi:hypothetical protein